MTIMMRLKTETRLCHEQLEQHPLSQSLMETPPRLEAISTLLQKFYTFYVPVEAQLSQQSGFDFDTRRKAYLLAQDLRRLDIDPDALPLCPQVPMISSLGQALGCAYVLEGATLGGQIINRHLMKHLNTRFAFYSSYGDEVGPMWKAFGAFVTQHATTPQIEEEIVASASETFMLLERWLDKKPFEYS